MWLRPHVIPLQQRDEARSAIVAITQKADAGDPQAVIVMEKFLAEPVPPDRRNEDLEDEDRWCPRCEGNAKVKCRQCRGHGSTECRRCDGRGTISSGVGASYTVDDCSRCDGRGYLTTSHVRPVVIPISTLLC